jgi:tyrosine-protein phosphatase non-receptor type 4
MGCPVLVSRVAPGTPADQCYPRLNEADQIIQINGKETVGMVHKDVVSAIRNAASVRKELVLRVRQNGTYKQLRSFAYAQAQSIKV